MASDGWFSSRWQHQTPTQKFVLISIVAFIAYVFLAPLTHFESAADKDAKQQGYESASDMSAGKASGLPLQAWRDKRDADARAAELRIRTAEAKIESECKANLQCWGEKGVIAAGIYCRTDVEKLAKYDFKWTDGWTESKFSRYRWKDPKRGIVTYLGDKISFQNGFGAFQRHIYTCDFEPVAKTVLSVGATPGRLD